jgi:arylamine N-acetyltransferase
LFYQLLTTLDFKVKLISARVFANAGYGPAFDHMAILATIGSDKYLVTVGNVPRLEVNYIFNYKTAC